MNPTGKIQQERDRVTQNPAREREDLLKIQQEVRVEERAREGEAEDEHNVVVVYEPHPHTSAAVQPVRDTRTQRTKREEYNDEYWEKETRVCFE